ncbi:AraC family transcriptional regulator [Paenibacillus puerhi]|uniref:AraC family transcriptional regulator n=1 Tax=Paenibacillus puerhi TaxID=2692622 RepID=UPI00135B48AE|nr:AraC family transcriptional regulator [Paenibacillus puerhi]
MRATVVIAPSTYNITQIAAVYEKAKSAKRYRSFENENQILDMEQPGLLMEPGGLSYPFAIERELIQALRAGERTEAMRHLALFVEALSAEGMKEIDVQQGMMRLLVGNSSMRQESISRRYLTELRMDKAKPLLKDSDIMINEIALLVGYQPSYFIRLFKKLEGITPGRFRDMIRSNGV